MAAKHAHDLERVGLTFDDVLLVPQASEVMPGQVDVATHVTKTVGLNIPVISSAMDTVTEARLAIAMALAGGVGVIHRNLAPELQAAEVERVKRFVSGMVLDPVTISPKATLKDALDLMSLNRFSGIPVVEPRTQRLVGILTNRDVRFATNTATPVSELMTKEKLITVDAGVSRADAKRQRQHCDQGIPRILPQHAEAIARIFPNVVHSSPCFLLLDSVYSYLSATIGSTLVARLAGMKQASSATAASVIAINR